MTQGAQDMIDTRALELATKANTRAEGLVEGLASINKWAKDHETHDEERFGKMHEEMREGFITVTTKISESSKGIYSRIWWLVGSAFGGLFVIVMFLVGKLVP